MERGPSLPTECTTLLNITSTCMLGISDMTGTCQGPTNSHNLFKHSISVISSKRNVITLQRSNLNDELVMISQKNI